MPDPSPHFPRGTPFKAPPEASAREPRPAPAPDFRAFALKLALGTVAAVTLIVAIGAFVVIRATRPSIPASPSDRNHLAALSPTSPEAPAVNPPTRRAETPTATKPDATPSREKEPPQDKAGPPAPRDELLDAVGGLIGAHLHQAYLNIGLLADAQENDVYSEVEAKRVLGDLVALLDNVDQQSARLSKADLDDADLKTLQQARKISVLLRAQAKSLRSYWETPEKDKLIKKDHESAYFKARDEAWVGIKELLAIKD